MQCNLTETVKNALAQYFGVDDSIKQLSDQLKELKSKKKEAYEYILNYMIETKQHAISYNDVWLICKQKTTKAKIDTEFLSHVFAEFKVQVPEPNQTGPAFANYLSEQQIKLAKSSMYVTVSKTKPHDLKIDSFFQEN